MIDKVIYKNAFPFFPTLGLIFITLKLTGCINWSWWWVTAPLWGGLALAFLFIAFWVLIFVVGLAIMFIFESMENKRK